MQMVSLSSIYYNLASHDNLDSRAVRNHYSETLEEQPVVFKHVQRFERDQTARAKSYK